MSYHLGMTDRALTYASYLKLQELLSLQKYRNFKRPFLLTRKVPLG